MTRAQWEAVYTIIADAYCYNLCKLASGDPLTANARRRMNVVYRRVYGIN